MNESLHRGVVITVCSAIVFSTVSASRLFAFFLKFPLFCRTMRVLQKVSELLFFLTLFINLLALELFFKILAHPVYKM